MRKPAQFTVTVSAIILLTSANLYAQTKCSKFFENSVKLDSAQIQTTAENLAKFRLDIGTEKNPDKKKILAIEFDSKFDAFASSIDSRSKAEQLLTLSMERLKQQALEEKKQKKIQAREREAQMKKEQKALLAWKEKVAFRPWHQRSIDKVLMNPDGSKMIILGGHSLSIYDRKTMKMIGPITKPGMYQDPKQFSPQPFKNIADCVLRPDGKVLIMKESLSRITAYDLEKMEVIDLPAVDKTPNVNSNPLSVSFSSDSSKFLTLDGNFVRIYDLKTHQETQIPASKKYQAWKAYFSRDDSLVFVQNENGIRTYNAKTGRERFWIRYGGDSTLTFLLSPDKEKMAVLELKQSSSILKVYNLVTGEKKVYPSQALNQFQLHFNNESSRLVLLSHEENKIVDLESNNEIYSQPPTNGQLQNVAFSDDRDTVFISSMSGLERVDTATQHTEPFLNSNDLGFKTLTESPDHNSYVIGTQSGELIFLFRDPDEADEFRQTLNPNLRK